MHQKLKDYLRKHLHIVQILYSRQTDIQYCTLIQKVDAGIPLISLRTELAAFYNIRVKKDFLEQMLSLIAPLKLTNRTTNPEKVFKEYYEKFSAISSRRELSYTSKLLNLRFRDMPIFDSRVLACMKLLGYDEATKNGLDIYCDLLHFYASVEQDTHLQTLITYLRGMVYGQYTLINLTDRKFLDTLLYTIADGSAVQELYVLGHIA